MRLSVVPLCVAALLAASSLRAQESGVGVPPLPSRVATAGQAAGETAAGTAVSATRAIGDAGKRLGGFFARGGKSLGRMCADLSVGLGRYCRRVFVAVFTDFQEKPAGTPLRYDQM
jgi:hypothetical protein